MAETARLLNLTLIRHAPSIHDKGHLPPADPEADISDTKAFGRLAKQIPDNATWWVSPLRRTSMTAEALIASGAQPGQMQLTPLLKEQDYGIWHGCPVADIWDEIKDGPLTDWHFLHPSVTPPEGESFETLWERGAELLKNIEGFSDDHLVLIGHAMIFRALIGQALQLDMEVALALGIAPLSRSKLIFLRGTASKTGSWMLDQLNLPA
jgi:alpha-ribazole phosphatase